jgi:thioredoxin 1
LFSRVDCKHFAIKDVLRSKSKVFNMKIALLIIGVAFVSFIVYMFFMARKLKNSPVEADSSRIVILNDKNFSQQIKSGVTVVDFWADWCMPCKMMIPILNQLAENKEHDAVIAKINIDENPQTAAKYSVRSIPTLLIFKNGKEVKRIVGVKPVDNLLKQIKSV